MNSIFKLKKWSGILAIVLVFSISATSFAQKTAYSDSWGKTGLSLKHEDQSGAVLNYSVTEFDLVSVDVRGEAMKSVLLPGHLLPNDEGAPDLPGKGRFIAVPQGATPVVNIVSMRTERMQNVEIAPAPRIPWDTDNQPLYYEKNTKIYSNNAFYPANPVQLGEMKQIRGVDAVMLGITPFQYNPVTKELIVYRDIEVEVTFEGGNGQFGDVSYRSRWFDPILQDAFINYNSLPEVNYSERAVRSNRDEVYDYVIIVPNDDDFISWAEVIKDFRTRQGIKTGIFTTEEIGGNNVNAITSFVDEAYETWDPKPTAFLLIGDYGTSGNTIVSPIWDNYCASDHLYADVDGDDIEDVIFARMTAQNEEQLETMVTKMINHEVDPPMSEDYYNSPITALGWQTERWFQICSETVGGYFKNVHGKDPVRINAIYGGNPNTDPWSTATNTSTVLNYFGPNGLGYIPATPAELGGWSGGTASDVSNAMNAGSFMLQHRDHGYEYGWGEPDFGNSSINACQNTDLTFIFSINCLTGKYNISNESFAEKFHRYKYNGENAGALGLIAASEVSYSFVNDTYVWGLYDNMWPDFMPDYGSTPEERGLHPAFANAAGKYFLMQSSWPYNTGNKEVTYNLFHHHGGAFLTLYSEVPQAMEVQHLDVAFGGLDFFTVNAPEGSIIALSVEGELIGTANGTGSDVDVPIIAQFPGTVIDIVVTKTNCLRYEEEVDVIPMEGAYVVKDHYTIDDDAGNGNGMIDYAEDILLSLAMINLGADPGENITVSISSTDPYIEITDGSEFYGTIEGQEIKNIENGFAFSVAGDIPDLHDVTFEISANDGNRTVWMSSMMVTVHAPELSYIDFAIDDSQGNGDGILDPGETVLIEVTIANSGTADSYDVMGNLFINDPYITIDVPNAEYGTVEAEANGVASFTVTPIEETPQGHYCNFFFNMEAFAGANGSGEFGISVGSTPILIADLDPNASSGTVMLEKIQEIGLAADYKTTLPNNLEGYNTIFVCLGIYGTGTNHQLSAAEGTRLKNFLDEGFNVYMEGGDTWFYDTQTPVHPYFNVTAVADGSGDCGPIMGFDDTFAEDWNFGYSGENNYIDHITAKSGADNLFRNAFPNYTVTVIYDEGSYKTIANSYEFGGLVDGDNTKLELMKEYLKFFGFGLIDDKPETPSGDNPVCSNATGSEYSVTEMNGVDFYVWNISPVEAGTPNGYGNTVTIDWNPDFTGDMAKLAVCATNGLGFGPESEQIEINFIDIPTAELSGDATLCYGESTTIHVELTGTAPWDVIDGIGGSHTVTASPWNPEVTPEASGAFTIQSVTDANGCSNEGSGSANFTVNPLPDVSLADGEVCDDGDLLITLDGTYESYEWFDGSTESTFLFNGADYALGEVAISVSVTNEFGCAKTDDATITVKDCSGIGELANVDLGIYPNPSNGVFTLELNGKIDGRINYRIVNAVGTVVYEMKDVELNGKYTNQIDINEYAEGVYFIFIESQEGVMNTKLVIQK